MPHPHTLTVELVARRQAARDDYVDALVEAFEPDDPIRRRAEAELDSWWPGTLPRTGTVDLPDGGQAAAYRPARREV